MISQQEKVIVLDFGGQYNQLIARRVRECSVYCEIKPYSTPLEEIKAEKPIGIIFTGGPNSVYEESSPKVDPEIFKLGIPILGICYGCQLMAWMLGGKVETAPVSEYGKIKLTVLGGSVLRDVPQDSTVWMSHTDYIAQPPAGFTVTGKTADCPCAAMENPERGLYAVQFHPEVTHTTYGKEMLHHFLFDVCGCSGDWQMDNFIEKTVAALRAQIGDKKVILGLSGGVDSSVAAGLLSRAVGKQLTCVFVDQGLMRKDEGDFVEKTFTSLFDMNFVRVNCQERFLQALKGVTDPEQKRKIIGTEFFNVFWDEIRHQDELGYFAQGTIYPDVIESGKDDAAVIKSHHNVGGLPDCVDFKEIVEPLRRLFKDEVRKLGTELGLPDELVWRQPFPGPGLAIRVIGDITEEKLTILREADAIFREEMKLAGLDRTTSQFFAVLTDLRSVGVMGDERTYDYTLALRAVQSQDFMTATWSRLPYELLDKVSGRIVGEVKHINRICYDITSKPPATVEWE